MENVLHRFRTRPSKPTKEVHERTSESWVPPMHKDEMNMSEPADAYDHEKRVVLDILSETGSDLRTSNDRVKLANLNYMGKE